MKLLPFPAFVAAWLWVVAGAAHADNLMSVWRAAQQRDPAYLAARQTMQLAQQRASITPVELARDRFRMAEQELALRVANAYFKALSARHTSELALAQLNAMAQQLRLAERAAESSPSLATDAREARWRFDAARVDRVAATRELEMRQAELHKVVGRSPGALEGLRADAPLWSPDPPDAAFWVSLANEDHPRVRLQKSALEAAVVEVMRRRDGDNSVPSVDFTANRRRIFTDGSLSSPAETQIRSRAAHLGLVLTVPLADTGPDSRVREALTLQERQEAELQAARSQAAQQARQAFAGVTQALARTDVLADSARKARAVLDAAVQAGLRAGARFRTDTLNAVQVLYTAERDWFTSRVDALLQGLQLKAAAGSLEERDIARLNGLLASQKLP